MSNPSSMKSVTISMYGKGLKHPDSGSLVREGYKKFTIDTEIVDLLSIINSPDSIESKEKAIEIVNQLILDSVKQLSSKLERDLSVSNFDDNKPMLFNPLKEEESSKFFDELIRGITIDDLHNEIVLSQLMSSSGSFNSFNSKMWSAFVIEILMPAVNGFRVLVMNQPMLSSDKSKMNISRLKQGQKMNLEDKNKIIERIVNMIECVADDSFGEIKEGSLIDLRIKQLTKESNQEGLENFLNMIDEIKNKLIEFAGSNLTTRALEWVSKTPKEIVELDL